MGRIIAAAVVIGIIVVEITWTYRRIDPRAAVAVLDLNHASPDVFAGIQKGCPGRCGVGRGYNAE
jgi:hypothetical protein